MASAQQTLPTRLYSDENVRLSPRSSRLSEAPTLTPTDIAESSTQIISRQKSPSFFRRRFGSVQSHPVEEEDARGPLGLRSLFCSPEPLIDLIFVHGLRGGSIKTWRHENDPQLFWPQFWLPLDPGFQHASIHSFGYDSDWGSTTPSILNVHDFGQSLYEEMRASPILRQNRKTPIVLIGHSMGGLVIKKAYTLAQQDSTHRGIFERIKCIFFLATPHRGSDYAALLNGILKVAGISGMASTREYIKDLTVGSTSTHLINEEFGKCASDVVVYSFCETLPMSFGVSSALIVNKASAVLGINPGNERVQYLHANHREICKFKSIEDSNYIILRNSLAAAVHDLLADEYVYNENESREQMRKVQDLLGVALLSEEHHEKTAGSCRWVEERDDFQRWLDSDVDQAGPRSYRPSLFWVQANPGTGKTILAAHVASQLKESRLPYASHYFHFGKKAEQSLTSFLRAIACQMTVSNSAIRQKLAQVHDEGASYDRDNARATWTRIFTAAIFQASLDLSAKRVRTSTDETKKVSSFVPQYWVVDAIDECPKYPELFTLLKGTQTAFPLRIFFTSRRLPDMPRLSRQLEGFELAIVQIPLEKTMQDIEMYVRGRISDLPIDEAVEREEVAKKILSKSNASFLWVRLVMDELEGVYGYESILQVLQGIPEGMSSYYQRAVAEMSTKKRELHIAKAILLWITLAARPLTINELSNALELDVKVHLPSAKSAVEGLCGQLISVDAQTGLVSPVHATAREFLLSEEAGEFQISKSQGHERIALTCLRLLCGPSLQPPRHRRLIGQKRPKEAPAVLLEYAVTQFSEHIFSASAESDQLLVALNQLLTTNILTWIEKIATQNDLRRLIRTAKNLKGYLDRRAKYRSPLNRHVTTVDNWTIDLSRVASKFGRALTGDPQSVYFLVPPLCPAQSAIHRQFGRSPDGLALLGSQDPNWEDCIAHIPFDGEIAAAISCGSNFIAVGSESGIINMYDHRSYQKKRVLRQKLPVDLIHFDPLGSFMATCSRKSVTLWDMDGNVRWEKRIRSRCILLASSASSLMVITQQGRSIQWDNQTGDLIEEQTFAYQAPGSSPGGGPCEVKAPAQASISPQMDLIAIIYRNSPTCIFELGSGSLMGWATDDNGRAAEKIAFNPNPDVNLLLVAYNESHLALYDSWSGTLMESQESEKPVILTSLSCSIDGRTFATMDILGHLRIWDFESLTLLYHVLTPNSSFTLLEFTSDGFSLVSLLENEMRIWAPSALVRKTVEEEASTSDQAAVIPVTEGQFEAFQTSKIRTIVAHPRHPVVFAGNYNGDVLFYQSQQNYQPSVVYSHHDAIVCFVAISETDAIASADMHGCLQVRQLDMSKKDSGIAEETLFHSNLSLPIRQLLFDQSGSYLLVSTSRTDFVYRTLDGSLIGSLDFSQDSRKTWKWTTASDSQIDHRFVLVSDNTLAIYHADRFPERLHIDSLLLHYGSENSITDTNIDSAVFQSNTSSLIVGIRQQNGYLAKLSTFIFMIPKLFTAEPGISLFPVRTLPVSTHLLQVCKPKGVFYFLHQNSWICSVDLKNLDGHRYTQHFFVPEEFITTSGDVPPVQTANGDFCFCLHDRLAVVRNGLKFNEVKQFSG